MRNIEELRIITRSIVGSYESKVNTVTSLMREVEQKIVEAYQDQNRAIAKIRDTLAVNRSLRKSDFERLIKPIIELQDYRKEQIKELLEEFCREEKENVIDLKSILERGNNSSWEDFYSLKEKILGRPRAAEAHLGELLKSFHQDQAELDVLLRRLLDKGENVQLKDVRKAVRAFQADHVGDGIILDEILGEFSKVKEDIGHQWEAVINTVGLRKFAARSTDE